MGDIRGTDILDEHSNYIAYDDVDSFETTAEKIFDTFGQVIPYDRIGIALVSEDQEMLELVWMKSRLPSTQLGQGYIALLKGTSLEKILIFNRPRIIHDLPEYLRRNPKSDSTRHAIADGIRSSLTCPLPGTSGPLGVIFFSSGKTHTYSDEHLQIYALIANTISASLQRSMVLRNRAILTKREDFYRRALHDFRSPIMVIRGHLELGREGVYGELNPAWTQVLETIDRQTHQLEKLLDDTQDGIDIGTSEFVIHKQNVSLPEFLKTVRMAAQSLLSLKDMHFKIVKARNLPDSAHLDPQRITQVLGNLINNAMKSSTTNSSVTLTVTLEDQHLKFNVQDEGAGISKQELSKIFEPQKRNLKATPSEFERCQGLGLFIVKKIIEDHGGKVWVTSEFGIGSSFCFILPIQPSPTC